MLGESPLHVQPNRVLELRVLIRAIHHRRADFGGENRRPVLGTQPADSIAETVILTQHGRSAAVLLNVESYESMLDELALLRDVRAAEEQVAAGKSARHRVVAKKLRARLAR